MQHWMLIPPVAFLVILVASIVASFFSKKLAAVSDTHPDGKIKAYACGEDVDMHRMQPDYGHFFPFAFFFTIMHVVALILTTVPTCLTDIFIAALYVAAAGVALLILFRRRES